MRLDLHALRDQCDVAEEILPKGRAREVVELVKIIIFKLLFLNILPQVVHGVKRLDAVLVVAIRPSRFVARRPRNLLLGALVQRVLAGIAEQQATAWKEMVKVLMLFRIHR